MGVALTLALGACVPGGGCHLEPDGTAPCGVLFGIATQQPSLAALAEAEAFAGRPYDLVYRFHGLEDVVPDSDERTIVESGRALHVNIEARVADTADATTWADVASGAHDRGLRAQARGLAGLDKPVFVTFDHEMDLPRKAVRGSPAQFVAAWRHVHDVFRQEGADNVRWVWVASGLARGLGSVGSLWPGNDVVDWISWDVYNHECAPDVPTASFAQSLDVFYSWLQTDGPAAGIDLTKPMMISELGSVDRDGRPAARAAWYAAIPEVLRERPQIKAITLWDYQGTCDYRVTGVGPMRATVRDLGADDLFSDLAVRD